MCQLLLRAVKKKHKTDCLIWSFSFDIQSKRYFLIGTQCPIGVGRRLYIKPGRKAKAIIICGAILTWLGFYLLFLACVCIYFEETALER